MKDVGPFSRRCNCKTSTNVQWFVFDIGSICIHGIELLRQLCIPSKIQKISQRNRCSTYLRNWQANNQMRSMEWKQRTGNTLHRSIYLWLVMKKSTVSSTQRSTYSHILYCALERWTRTLSQILHGKTDWRGSKVHHITELWTQLMVSQWKSSGIFPEFTTLQLCNKVQEFLSKMSVEPEGFTRRIIFMSMFNDISWGSKDNEHECELSAKLVSIHARIFSPGRWSFLGPRSEKKWYSTHEYKPQGEWERVAELMMIKFGGSGHPVFRATSPSSRGTLKSKVVGNCQYTSVSMEIRLKLFFRTSISVNQLSVYGAVSDLCEEILAGKDRRYSLKAWIPWIRITGIRKSLIWPKHVLHGISKSGKGTVYWVEKQLAQRKRIEVLSNKIERHHPLRYTPSLLYLESSCGEI